MDLVTFAVVAVLAWIILLVVVAALCSAASRADAQSDRLYISLR
jgi:hypothetical protein